MTIAFLAPAIVLALVALVLGFTFFVLAPVIYAPMVIASFAGIFIGHRLIVRWRLRRSGRFWLALTLGLAAGVLFWVVFGGYQGLSPHLLLQYALLGASTAVIALWMYSVGPLAVRAGPSADEKSH